MHYSFLYISELLLFSNQKLYKVCVLAQRPQLEGWRTNLDRGSVYLGIVEETIPQTDSVPSVYRAISCFNKHIYRRHFRQSVVSIALFPIAERPLWAVEVHVVPVARHL